MRRPRLRTALRSLLVAAAALAVLVLVLRAAAFSVSLGEPPEFGWTSNPTMTVVHWVKPDGSITPGKLPPRRCRGTPLGTLVTWAYGIRTLYIHR